MSPRVPLIAHWVGWKVARRALHVSAGLWPSLSLRDCSHGGFLRPRDKPRPCDGLRWRSNKQKTRRSLRQQLHLFSPTFAGCRVPTEAGTPPPLRYAADRQSPRDAASHGSQSTSYSSPLFVNTPLHRVLCLHRRHHSEWLHPVHDSAPHSLEQTKDREVEDQHDSRDTTKGDHQCKVLLEPRLWRALRQDEWVAEA